ncbi:MBL fold metallo-hydrolase [Micromonospora zamorensis]|uniref:MBL fold metallo-hydrolase n=1 Tax=Micromonospora zamorensis TaxID=709883 RepID=UPI00378FE7F0
MTVAGPAVASVAAELTEVADGVFAYTQPNGGWCLSNAGIVTGPDGLLLVDTAATERRARALADRISGLRAGPVRTLVNTHHHGDHTFGNQIFSPSATVIAHERARQEMAETGLALTGLWPDVRWGDIRVVLPDVTFAHELTVHVGERRAELLHVGPAHSTNDVVVWLPHERVLFAGDVLMSTCTPFLLFGSVSGALDAVARLRALQPRTVVCGHGPVTGPEIFDVTERYLRRVAEVAAEAHPQGRTPLEAARESDWSEFAHLLDPERVVGNLHRAYAELAGGPPGAPLPVAGVVAEMIEYNGGRPLTCLA